MTLLLLLATIVLLINILNGRDPGQSFLQALRSNTLNTLKNFIQNSWIEIICGIGIYFLLEDKIKNISEIPDTNDHNAKDVLSQFRNETMERIKILDLSIAEYLKEPEYFKDCIKSALANRVRGIQILLLHPETYAVEQRHMSIDPDTRIALKGMKKTLRLLQTTLNSLTDKERTKIEVKLFQRTPTFTYVSWDANANFCLLKPGYGRNKNYLVKTTTPLFETFNEYFSELWKVSTVSLEDYLYLQIKPDAGPVITKVYWAGNSEQQELPRYITSKTRHRDIENLCKERSLVTIWHDARPNKGRLRKIDPDKDRHKMAYAQKRIADTYDSQIGELNNAIYEIEYFYDNRQILLQDRYAVSKKLEENWYAFVPHNSYDISLNGHLKSYMESIHFCYEKLLEVDKHDEAAIDEKRKIDPNHKGNPRNRLFAVFNVKCDKNKLPEILLDENDRIYPVPREINPQTGPAHKDGPPETRIFTTISEQRASRQDAGSQAHLDTLYQMIRTVIEDDLHYIFGTENFLDLKKEFKVYVHCIRTIVTSVDGLSNIADTTQSYDLHPDIEYQYQVTHLINRKNIFGGSNTISINKKEESFLLKNPLDTIFYKTKLPRRKGPAIKHFSEQIRLDKEDDDNGVRDVLVIEFKEMSALAN